VNGILKTELKLDTIFRSYSHAVAVVHQAVDAYNRLRPHMSISNLTPNQAHYSTQNLFKKWKKKNTVKPNQYYCEPL
jgi:putative transposase